MYSREILYGLASAFPEAQFFWCYRPHRFLPSRGETLPSNARRRLLWDWWAPKGAVFHGLNQRLPRRLRQPSVVTFHDLFVLTSEYASPEFRRRFAAQARDAAARAHLLIAVSQFTATQLVDLLRADAGRIRVIPHGVHLPQTPPPPQQEREPLILHVGAIQKRKNIHRLVEAFERIDPPWRLVLAGSEGYGAAEILERIRASKAFPRITLAGYVSRAQLEQLYRRAAILAFPSLDEGFGIPLLEAMAYGVAVLTSNRGALREVASGAALLVDPLCTDEMAEGLRRLTETPQLRRVLAEKGFAVARQYGWKEAVAKTWQAYRDLGAG